MPQIEKDIEQINASLQQVGDQLKKHAEAAAKNADLNAETRKTVDGLLLKQGELQANLQQAQQLLAKIEANGAGGDVQHQSIGQQFVNSEAVKNLMAMQTPRGRVDMPVKAAITSLTTDADGSAGDLVQTTRVPGILTLPQRRMTVRDLLTPGNMDGNALEYVKETGFTNNAGMVAEATKKPESSIKFDLVATTAKVIAHYMKASRQILSDASQLASFIDGRLRYGLAFKEEQQLLNGDGTGQNLLGIIPQATAFAAPFDPAGTETNIDNIRLAFLQSELAEYPATGVVMNPIDWARIELTKDTTGRYIIGNPQGVLGATLWNRPVVTTQAITVDKFLAGAFRLGAQIFDRWQARVEVATENEDDFVKNLVTILAEERLALAVYRPEAFIYGDFGNVT
ncbi:phage major capsid protein [Paracidovorax citrulli]|uniref:phage major capsid protein n=1 Tax=Paracidovorax citrulli TaxID=80869 RepID=UPI0005FB062B|nr:phage major capsid protein [Paracidovorax citrulli]UMT88371.1 phage major capsid protein [Paracidovorax citrulli]WIY32720.1 phage major capsid protein [Paracidovorax citrulli]SDJ31207.1 phage major capsid protein, HK97 family [Paracidovorax citrulli]